MWHDYNTHIRPYPICHNLQCHSGTICVLLLHLASSQESTSISDIFVWSYLKILFTQRKRKGVLVIPGSFAWHVAKITSFEDGSGWRFPENGVILPTCLTLEREAG